MKIAIKGFRGFHSLDEFIDLKDVTILTGKNGGGKSTLMKFLQLISQFDFSVPFDSLFDQKIDIANDAYGGKDKVLTPNYDDLITMRLEHKLDFYSKLVYCDIEFEVRNDNLSLSMITISDVVLCEVIFVIGKNAISSNNKLLFESYKRSSVLYNIYNLKREISLETIDHDDPVNNKIIIDKLESNLCANMDIAYAMNISDDEINSYKCNIGSIEKFNYLNDQHVFTFYQIEGYDDIKLIKIQEPKNMIIEESKFTHLAEDIVSSYEEKILSLLRKNRSKKSINRIKEKDWVELLIKKYTRVFATSHNENYSLSFRSLFLKDYIWTKSLQELGIKANQIDEDDETVLTDIREEIDELVADCTELCVLMLHFNTVYRHIVSEDLSARFSDLSKLYIFGNYSMQMNRSINIFDKKNNVSTSMLIYSNMSEYLKARYMEYLSKWMKAIFDIDGVEINIFENQGFLYAVRGTIRVNMADEGSGINTILSFLMSMLARVSSRYKLIESNLSQRNELPNESKFDAFIAELHERGTGKIPYDSTIIYLEEPESKLHPKAQSMLADLIFDLMSKTNLRFIIETHSEYIIRKMQYLIASDYKDAREKVNMYYFDMTNREESRLISFYEILIKENGYLSKEFGNGFLDEADSIAIKLHNLNTIQNN